MSHRQYTLNPTTKADDSLKPLLMSLLVHGIVVALLFFLPSPKPPVPSGMQATLVSADEFATITGQIRENARLAAHTQTTAKSLASSQSTTPTPSHLAQSYNAELQARQEAYRQQIAAFAAEQDAQALANVQAVEAALKAEALEQARELQALRHAAAQQHKREAENRQALQAAHQANQARNEAREQTLRALGGENASMSAASSNGTNSAHASPIANTAQGGGSTNNIKSALERHIYAHWEVPMGTAGQKLSANIRTDANGNVLSISISGGTPALKASLERAIHQASPLTPVIGTDYRSFTAHFTAN